MSEALDYQLFDSRQQHHIDAVTTLAQWSQGENMLPLSFESVKAHLFGLLAFRGSAIAGYRAVTASYENDTYYELGGLLVAPHLRGQGLGYKIAEHHFAAAREVLPSAKYLIFVNTASKTIAGKLGFVAPKSLVELPRAIFDPCVESCTEYAACRLAGKMCCHEIVVWEPTT